MIGAVGAVEGVKRGGAGRRDGICVGIKSVRDRPERQVAAIAADVGLLELGLRIEIRVVGIGRLGYADRAGLDVGLDMANEIGDVDMAGRRAGKVAEIRTRKDDLAAGDARLVVDGKCCMGSLIDQQVHRIGRSVVDVNMIDLLIRKVGIRIRNYVIAPEHDGAAIAAD